MLTQNQVQAAFKTFGKLIKLAQTGDEFAATLKLTQMATAEQVTDATEEAYPIFRAVVIPLELSVGRTISSIESVPLRARQALENYVACLADDLGVSKAATMQAKLNALKSSMISAEETIAPSGVFDSYFRDRWGVALPSDDDETIPDSWISTSII